MTGPFQANNSDNSPGGLGTGGMLNPNGFVGNGNQQSYLGSLIDEATSINLNPLKQNPVMKTMVYSPDIRVVVSSGGKEYDVSSNVVRGQLFRVENSASTFICELTNKNEQYTKNGGLFDRMDRIAVWMKRINWVQVFSGYLDTVPFAQMWAGNVTIKATCTLKRLLYTYWNPNLAESRVVFSQMGPAGVDAGGSTDTGLGDLTGNLVCWVGGWNPQNVHIQDFPLNFFNAMETEFQKISQQNQTSGEDFKDILLGYDHTAGVGSAAGTRYLSTGPGLGPQVIGSAEYKQQVIKAVDDRGMGPSVKDIQNSYQAEQLSSIGETAIKTPAVVQAFQQNSALAGTMQTQARSADAAILAFACVMAESGWLNRANAQIPESLSYPHEAMSTDHDSIGLFQQRNSGWGTVAQRMNPYASAGMFLDELSKFAWREMDPAEAIARVQRNRDGAATYITFIAEATQEVSAIRAGQGKYNPPAQFGGIGVSSLVQAVSGQSLNATASTLINSVANSAISQNNPSPGAIPIGNTGRPQPDAQGAVNCALSSIGRPFRNGASGPESFDAPGLIDYCYRSIGLDIGPGTAQQSQRCREKISSLAVAQPGDVIQTNGGQHTAILVQVAPPLIVEAPPDGTGIVRTAPLIYPDIAGIYRYADYGGPGPAPFNPVAKSGLPVGLGSTGGLTGTGSDGQQEQVARNLFSYIFTPAVFAPSIAQTFRGEKSFIDCEPLIQEVQAICRAGLRNFASAPNGDFIAYYPDYFGVDEKPIAFTIEDIEMKDVRINLTDDAMTTHVYVSGDVFTQGLGQKSQVLGWLQTNGVATVENETLFQRLKRVVPGKTDGLSGQAILQKYGVRPLQMEFNMLASHKLEFLVACQLFMQKWAEQYETLASFTFMPELFPGMRVGLAKTGIAVYVSEVTHTFDWEQGFSTTAKILAPSSANGAKVVDNVIYNMPSDITKPAVPTTVPGN
jgi:hypothetical protein